MKKIILYNIVAFTFMLGVIEILFQINARIPFLPFVADIPLMPYSTEELKKETILTEFGPYAYDALPSEYKIIQDPRVFKYQYKDIDQYNKFPAKVWTNPNGMTFFIQEKNIKNTDISVYSFKLRFDDNGLRHVENKDSSASRKFILAAGDSFTFGEGVGQGLDYPSQLASKLGNKWFVYNYGNPGDGPNDFFHKSSRPAFFHHIKEKEGIFIWLAIPYQFLRMNPGLEIFYPTYDNSYILEKHSYIETPHGFHDEGTFKDTHAVKFFFQRILGKSRTLEYFHPTGMTTVTRESAKKFLGLLNTALSSNRLHIVKKYFVTYDFQKLSPEIQQEIKEAGFELIEFDKLKSVRPDLQLSIHPDGHPSSESYWLLSEALRYRIEKDQGP